MTRPDSPKRLRKDLGLLDVYAISTGATLSAGFFLLPGLAAVQAGPALVLGYLLAAIPLLPALLSLTELMTAMPRAGGVYFFLARSLGPLVGTIGGAGTWLVLVLKVAFALVGMGAYIALYLPELSITPAAIVLALLLGGLSVRGTKMSGRFQVALVLGLLTVLTGFIGGGLAEMRPAHLRGIFDRDASAVLATAGLVYISYIGVTKIASLSEEVKDPERNLPLGLFLSMTTVLAVYGLGTLVLVGVVPHQELAGDLTPVATAAEIVFGGWGRALLSAAAIAAFLSVANAGTLSGSRYPLAMSRDRLAPPLLQRIGRRGTPVYSIVLTTAAIVATLALLDPVGIAKLASTFQLLVLALICFAVIVMRKSGLESYDPGYRSPFYPWTQIVGIVAPLALIVEMGALAIGFGVGLAVVGTLWYLVYGRSRAVRAGAIDLVERPRQEVHADLDRELRGILKEKGLRAEDPFDEIVARSVVLDLSEEASLEEVTARVAERLAPRLRLEAAQIQRRFLEGTRIGLTPVTRGAALPHFRLPGLLHPELALVRCRAGVRVARDPASEARTETAHALFFLVSPEADPARHLRILAELAGRIDEGTFLRDWAGAPGEQELREVLLRDERFLTLTIAADHLSGALIGRRLRDAAMPEGSLVTWIRRGNAAFVPRGDTVLREGDRLTVIGDAQSIRDLEARYRRGSAGSR